MFKKFVKKAFKRIKKIVKPIGKALKKGLGKIGKAFGKLGPIGTLALTLMLPGLGAAWGTFGNWAATASGPLGAVMRGIHAAGNVAGNIFSRVSDMVGSAVKNTVGKLPVGKGKNLADVYGEFSNWVGNKLDDFRLKAGLPTSNRLTPEIAATDAETLGKEITSIKGTDAYPQFVDAEVSLKDGSGLLSKSSPTAITTPDTIGAGDIDIDFKMGKPDLPSMKNMAVSQGNTTNVVTGFEVDKSFIGEDVEVIKMTPNYETVPSSVLSKDQIYRNNRLNAYAQSVNTRSDSILKAAKDNPLFSQRDVLSMDTQKLAGFTGKAAVLETGLGEEEQQVGYTAPADVIPLPTNVTTASDYERQYSQQFNTLGYQGPNTLAGFAQAGYYGGDPFSFNQLIKSNAVAVPQATVNIG